MGLFGKIKNIFYDEEIVEVPVEETKKEERPRIEEIHLPKKEIAKPVDSEEKNVSSPIYSEREIFKTENTFKFPVIDESDEEPIKTRVRPNVLDLERTTKKEIKPEINTQRNTSIEKTQNAKTNNERTFRPSPIISPVYGVLDKNYKKEEIMEKQHTIRHTEADMNYDSVRRKAYGTLEDELENTLSKISSRTNEVMQTIEEVENLDTEANSKSIEDLLSEIEGNHDYDNISIGEIEEKIKDKMEEDETRKDTFVNTKNDSFEKNEIKFSEPKSEFKNSKTKETEEDDGFDKTLEHDLFNLIDSMYEEREGE